MPEATTSLIRAEDLPLRQAFARDQRRRGLAAETVRVRDVVLFAFERALGRSLLSATRDEINAWLDSLGLAVRSRGKYLSHLRNLYAFAIREELTDRDPTASILHPRAPRLMPRPIADDDLALAIAAAAPKMAAMLSLAAYQGLRVKEIAGQRAEDVLRGQDPALLVVTTTKGGEPRVLPLADAALRALTRHGMPESGPLFLSQRGRPYQPCTITRLIADHLRSLGADSTAHKLRHWFATECYRRSRDLRMTQELLGHASVLTTQAYVAWSPDDAVELVRNLTVQRRA